MSRGSTHYFGDGCGMDHGSWANMSKALDAERALADDAGDVLALVEARANTADVEVQRWLARYREARQR